MRLKLTAIILAGVSQIVGCASSQKPGDIPYPAFIQVDELQDTSVATMPGVRATPFSGNVRTNTFGSQIDIPPGWSGTTGVAPDKSVEIFVLAGKLRLSGYSLDTGGYAYLPAGKQDYRLRTSAGAQVIYFLDEPDPKAFIRSPIIKESTYDWHYAIDGVHVILLRHDGGNGSRSWLRKVTVGASEPWESSSADREGYLVSGDYTTSECVAGKAVTGTYRPGGYFRRPASALSGGPEANAISESVWFFREGANASVSYRDECPPAD